MMNETDVLIVGAGPTGLMMACQLARFGVSFNIIDKQSDHTPESRAFGIQAKTMEIFQNLGIDSEFVKRAQIAKEISFYVNGRKKFALNFEKIDIRGAPFPHLYLLPQSETEQILLEHLAKNQFTVERQKELLSFEQINDKIEANVKNNLTANQEKIRCRYIVGCDGAHSAVRRALNIPFEGAAYNQEFVLADVTLEGDFAKDNFTFFMSKEGFFAYIPLQKNFCRLMIASLGNELQANNPPTLAEIKNFAKQVTHKDIKLSNPVWISRFFLHHRAVKQYQKGSAFLAGDAAHIHSPVGGQGMNTGLQDATNLAWKLAFVLKHHAPNSLLETYQIERQRIGQMLVNTTDRIFGLMTEKNFIIRFLRQYIIPTVMHFLSKSNAFLKRIFCFASELNIHYHINEFIVEKAQGADTKFLSGPRAGWRAPDAPSNHSTLFQLLRKKPCHILIFQSSESSNSTQNEKIEKLEKMQPEIIAISQFNKTPKNELLFDRYGVTDSAVYFIRPDGYIGFRSFGNELKELFHYLQTILPKIKPIDE